MIRLITVCRCWPRRSPHGERGLKWIKQTKKLRVQRSLSSRRAWIEIIIQTYHLIGYCTSLSSRRAWIEIQWKLKEKLLLTRRSPHGERGLKSGNSRQLRQCSGCRSPHGERGLKSLVVLVELLKMNVALLTESVDWNFMVRPLVTVSLLSLSSRRAWIEIAYKKWVHDCLRCRSPHGERGLK